MQCGKGLLLCSTILEDLRTRGSLLFPVFPISLNSFSSLDCTQLQCVYFINSVIFLAQRTPTCNAIIIIFPRDQSIAIANAVSSLAVSSHPRTPLAVEMPGFAWGYPRLINCVITMRRHATVSELPPIPSLAVHLTTPVSPEEGRVPGINGDGSVARRWPWYTNVINRDIGTNSDIHTSLRDS